MEQRGKVLSVKDDIATVELLRESACRSCHHKNNCGVGVIAGCSKAEKVTIIANNVCGAGAGDSVVLSSNSAKTLGIAFSVFVLPLILTFLAYFICKSFVLGSAVTATVTIISFFISFFGLFFGFNSYLAGKITVDVTDIIREEKEND